MHLYADLQGGLEHFSRPLTHEAGCKLAHGEWEAGAALQPGNGKEGRRGRGKKGR